MPTASAPAALAAPSFQYSIRDAGIDVIRLKQDRNKDPFNTLLEMLSLPLSEMPRLL